MHFPEQSPRLAALFGRLRGRNVAVIGHARPDGDCIGSQVALARLLATQGIDAVCVNPDPVPRRLEFIVEGARFLRTDDVLPLAAGMDAVFVDCADHGRAGERLRAAFPSPVAAIDHHLSNAGFGSLNFLDTSASATCELLAGMMLDLGLPMDLPTARALYAGILTDTGQFRFNSTTRRTFSIASGLLEHGVVPAEVAYHIYEREPLGKIRLLQQFLSSLELCCGGRACIGVLRRGVFAETGTTAEDAEGLVDYARIIDGVDIGVLIEEKDDGSAKASLRSKEPAYRVDLIAAQFGGGGHACAAGLNLRQSDAGFRERLVAVIQRQLDVTAPAR
jgi:phosphoesterase RecJ-like protein